MSQILSYRDLQTLIPERRPLLMLDRLQINGTSAVGLKAVSMDEEYFQGHFPGGPIMPGVLQVTAMAQVACTLLPPSAETDTFPVVKEISRLKFRKPVLPGDQMQIEVEQVENEPTSFKAKTIVDGQVAAQGILTLARECRTALEPAPTSLIPAIPEFPGFDGDAAMDINQLMGTIPHRYPFLLIDRVQHLDAEEMRIVARKNITGNEPYFAGTPTHTVPFCLQVEMAAQAGCALAMSCPENQNKIGYFMSIDEARNLSPVVPGDQMIFDFTLTGRGRFGKTEGKVYVGERVVAEMALKFALVDRP
jgi:3-hydroxymyristoyl/3-hydroxydecanoyl-(acyl carrier protein) dehydratase